LVASVRCKDGFLSFYLYNKNDGRTTKFVRAASIYLSTSSNDFTLVRPVCMCRLLFVFSQLLQL
jgi:hypothetical protein